MYPDLTLEIPRAALRRRRERAELVREARVAADTYNDPRMRARELAELERQREEIRNLRLVVLQGWNLR